jgi:bifunctional UDP-N-acetylglucosamine pyrophosphorylase/glucosamine-1-phosphate N-acetyltransferase
MGSLTDTLPKPLIPVCGKPILEHIVEALPIEVDELILVVGYRKEQIEAYCGTNFKGRKVTYVHQENFMGGTGEALMLTKPFVSGKFLFMYGDDIHGARVLAEAVHAEHAILSAESKTPERFGVLMLKDDGTLKSIIEKPEHPQSNRINIGGYVLTPAIFDCEVARNQNGELYATDMFTLYAEQFPVKVFTQDLWIPIGYPEHIAEAEKILCPLSIDNRP